ncbi:MAG: hypothetical protein WBV61_14080, partial [Rhodanobacteraceae bacterium]
MPTAFAPNWLSTLTVNVAVVDGGGAASTGDWIMICADWPAAVISSVPAVMAIVEDGTLLVTAV